MRTWLLAAIACFLCIGGSASAATTVTTGAFCVGTVGCNIKNLAPFDSSLGELTSVTLILDVNSQTQVLPFFPSVANYPEIQTGSASLSYTSPFILTLNGATYSLDFSGNQQVSYTAAALGFQPFIFQASGSKLSRSTVRCLLPLAVRPMVAEILSSCAKVLAL